jgi:hypothetical protein
MCGSRQCRSATESWKEEGVAITNTTIAMKIERYSISIMQSNLEPYTRYIRLFLETGWTAFVAFPETRPPYPDWLEILEDLQAFNLYMTADQFADVVHEKCPGLRGWRSFATD